MLEFSLWKEGLCEAVLREQAGFRFSVLLFEQFSVLPWMLAFCRNDSEFAEVGLQIL